VHSFGGLEWVRQCQHHAGAFGSFLLVFHKDGVQVGGDFASLDAAKSKASEWKGSYAYIIVKGKNRKLVYKYGGEEWVGHCLKFVNGVYGLYYHENDCFYGGHFASHEEAKQKAEKFGGRLVLIIVKGRKRKVVEQYPFGWFRG